MWPFVLHFFIIENNVSFSTNQHICIPLYAYYLDILRSLCDK
ncbi:Uncharacterised protein [Vibrio cholerae]|nr:Uncharacterised protein [Vibrio cholerae]